MRQFQCAPTTYVTEIKETYFEIYTKQVSCPLALPISTKIPVNCLYLLDSYTVRPPRRFYEFRTRVMREISGKGLKFTGNPCESHEKSM